ncbi:hypothetical protein EFQ99_16390 [Rhizobium vallis]|uniref:Core-binding (CB) domain-containing protein n=1 Tax=Rhizobium vallis TaxID=634290 RepID=A0A3S0Y4S2_9HYPH|nr:hypothetical protein [Rhizobium vallis]RUM24365.1 hypothetical protein EFQ99_16390 [Rhizobium vallis]
MRYAELPNIWQEDLSGLSGAALGRVYVERATERLVSRAIDPSLYEDWGKIDVDRACQLIGCKRSALYQNTGIRTIISDLQEQDAKLKPADGSEHEQAAEPKSNVIQFPMERARPPSRYIVGKIVVVKVKLALSKAVSRDYSIPTLFWEDGIDREVSHYIRALALEERPLSTLLEYLKILREFRRFCRQNGIPWLLVNDDTLRAYRALKLNKGIKTRRINTITGVIFQFYAWAERVGMLRNHVQLYEPGDYPPELWEHPFAITSDEFTKKDGAKIRVSRLRIPDTSPKANRPTVTDAKLKLVKYAEEGSRHEERNSLAYSWIAVTGARSFELLQVIVGKLPTREQLDRIFAGALDWTIEVKRKGGRDGKLVPTADLLRRTLNFAENERAAIVKRCESLGLPVEDGLFLTDKGTTLAVSSFQGLARLAFQRAGVAGSAHRIRAIPARKAVEVALDVADVGDVELGPDTIWKHAILMRAADILDHRSTRTLEHYLNDLINSRVQKSAASKLHMVESAISEKELTLAALERRIEARTKELDINRLIADFRRTGTLAGATAEEVRTLEEFQDEFDTAMREFKIAA